MDDFMLFVCGVVVTLIAGMGVITSQVFMGYSEHVTKPTAEAKARREAAQAAQAEQAAQEKSPEGD